MTIQKRKVKKLNVLVGGPTQQWPDTLKSGQIEGPWIGVDRGAIRLLQLGIKPEIAVGDFDSTAQEELARVKEQVIHIETFPPEKDLTDTQIGVITAIRYFEFEQLTIYGATGGRMDHLLANIFLPLELRFRPYVTKIKLIDRQNTITYYQPGMHEIKKESNKKYLAFVTLTKVDGLTLFDEKYPLDDYSSSHPTSWASNEFNGNLNHFKFDSGIVAVIQSRD